MKVFATGFNPVSQMSVVCTMVVWESSLWLEKYMRSTGKRDFRKAWIGAATTAI